MTTFDPARAGSPFVGRKEELATIAAAAEAALSGHPWLVWVEGAAGSGKTSLVRTALSALAPEFVTLRASADELAADIPYELVTQLGTTKQENPFAVGQELLRAWSHLQERGPVAVVIEDLHWVDASSALAILSAVKRLDRDRVLVIVTSRRAPDENWDRLSRDEDRCRRLELASFGVDDVTTLASLQGVDLTSSQAERLWHHTGGHPIWVRTLLAELSPGDLAAPDGDLPAPRSLASAVTARLAELSPEARTLAAALAVTNNRTPLPVVGRVASIAAPVEAFEALLATGFVRWDPGQPGPPVEFTHPLYRLAVYEDLSPVRRRDLHSSAAEVLPPAVASAHRVAAADGADDELADELESLTIVEPETKDLGVAARNLLWASTLSTDSAQAERRLLAATFAFLDCGQLARAAGLRAEIEQCGDGPARNLILGLIESDLGHASRAEHWLQKAVRGDSTDLDAPSAARAWAQLAELHVIAGRAGDAVDAARKALELAEANTSAERLAWIHLATGEAMLHGGSAGLQHLGRRLPEDPSLVSPTELDMLVARATIGYYAARNDRARADLGAVLAMARRGHVPVQLARCHYLMSALLTSNGEWNDAVVHARTALSIASDDQLAWMQSQCHATLGILLASRGEWEDAEFHVNRATVTALGTDGTGNIEAFGTARLAVAALARARDEPERVIEALEDLATRVPALTALHFWPPLIWALVDAGRLDEARNQIDALARAAAARDIDLEGRLFSLRARLAGATGQSDQASELFESALARMGPNDPFLDRALTHHAYGRVLHARGDRRRAIDHLRLAREQFDAVGATPFLARVETDLAAAGLRQTGSSTGRSTLHLTDRERDVALLVGRGMTNPEVAAELYVSRKAVEYHLSNIYAKLGITSRRELRDRRFSG